MKTSAVRWNRDQYSTISIQILLSGGETVIQCHVEVQRGAEPCGKLLTESEKEPVLIDNKSSCLRRARRSLSGNRRYTTGS